MKSYFYTVVVEYEYNGKKVREKWYEDGKERLPEAILRDIRENPRYPSDAKIELYF